MTEITKKIFPRKLVHGLLTFATNFLIFVKRFSFKKLIIRKNTSDHMVFRDIYLLKEFNLPVEIEPKLIVDLGAYTGLSTLYYAKKFPKAKIIAVEPEKSNFDVLVEHTEHLPAIVRIHAGIWSSSTNLKIENKSSEKWAFTLTEVGENEDFDITSTTVDNILMNSGFSVIDILKIDIEGSEKEIFSKNFESWINKVNIIVIELHDRMINGCSKALFDAVNMESWTKYTSGEKVILVRKHYLN